ncbi:hypothetical protein [Thermococcus sp.]
MRDMLQLIQHIGEVFLALALFSTFYVFYFSIKNKRTWERYLVLTALLLILIDAGSDILRYTKFSSRYLDIIGSFGEFVGAVLTPVSTGAR